MPELPEVEVLRLSLERALEGRRIERVEVLSPSLREPLDRARLRRLTSGRRIVALRRRAKYLLVELAGGATLVVHLGMSGRFTVVPAREPVAKHEHVAFHLDSGARLRMVDPRRFGLVFALPTLAIAADEHFRHLGIEPLGPELDSDYLAARASGRRGPIKPFLMDGRLVVGVGNIYACESLWRARVHPRRAVTRVSKRTWQAVAEAVRTVLSRAIEQGGTTLNDFTDGAGNAGYFQVSLSVYGREGDPCSRCGRLIRRLVQAGRSTFYCPGCQH